MDRLLTNEREPHAGPGFIDRGISSPCRSIPRRPGIGRDRFAPEVSLLGRFGSCPQPLRRPTPEASGETRVEMDARPSAEPPLPAAPYYYQMPYVEYDEIEAICSECGRVFRSEETLTAHKEEAHAGLDAPRSPPRRPRAPPPG